jgi:hypothetical protein
MKIKRIKKISVAAAQFDVRWDKKEHGAWFNYQDKVLCIGTAYGCDSKIFDNICHELMEICAIELCVRLSRPDCNSDYIFVYDHRQHTTMQSMFSAALAKFIV